jgi:hypothetical protein
VITRTYQFNVVITIESDKNIPPLANELLDGLRGFFVDNEHKSGNTSIKTAVDHGFEEQEGT